MAAYNYTAHTGTGYSPYELVHGRIPILPFDATLDPTEEQGHTSVKSYYQRLVARLKEMHSRVHERMVDRQLESVEKIAQANARRAQFKEGDKILLYVPAVPKGISKKLALRWHGPYEILGPRIGRHYQVSVKTTNATRVCKVHEPRLRKYNYRHKVDDRVAQMDVSEQLFEQIDRYEGAQAANKCETDQIPMLGAVPGREHVTYRTYKTAGDWPWTSRIQHGEQEGDTGVEQERIGHTMTGAVTPVALNVQDDTGSQELQFMAWVKFKHANMVCEEKEDHCAICGDAKKIRTKKGICRACARNCRKWHDTYLRGKAKWETRMVIEELFKTIPGDESKTGVEMEVILPPMTQMSGPPYEEPDAAINKEEPSAFGDADKVDDAIHEMGNACEVDTLWCDGCNKERRGIQYCTRCFDQEVVEGTRSDRQHTLFKMTSKIQDTAGTGMEETECDADECTNKGWVSTVQCKCDTTEVDAPKVHIRTKQCSQAHPAITQSGRVVPVMYTKTEGIARVRFSDDREHEPEEHTKH